MMKNNLWVFWHFFQLLSDWDFILKIEITELSFSVKTEIILNKSFSAEHVLRYVIQKLNSHSVVGLGEKLGFYVDLQFESYFNTNFNCLIFYK